MRENSVYHIQAAGTFTILTGAGFLHTLTVNTTASGTITLYDQTTATGVPFAVIKASVAEQTFVYDVHLVVGLTVVTGGASDVSISYT